MVGTSYRQRQHAARSVPASQLASGDRVCRSPLAHSLEVLETTGRSTRVGSPFFSTPAMVGTGWGERPSVRRSSTEFDTFCPSSISGGRVGATGFRSWPPETRRRLKVPVLGMAAPCPYESPGLRAVSTTQSISRSSTEVDTIWSFWICGRRVGSVQAGLLATTRQISTLFKVSGVPARC